MAAGNPWSYGSRNGYGIKRKFVNPQWQRATARAKLKDKEMILT